MDWKIFASTFLAIFVAELGDKTQLAALSLSAESKARMAVFFGSAVALIATSAIAVLAGDVVARTISPVWIRRVGGVIFVVLGALMLVRREGLSRRRKRPSSFEDRARGNSRVAAGVARPWPSEASPNPRRAAVRSTPK